METPVLTKKQLKSTLSAKKTRPKETLKNVLVVPYNTSFWPEILPEDYQNLFGLLEENLPRLKNDKVNVPWDKIKQVPKPERKTIRENFIKDLTGVDPSLNKNTGTHVGINDVTKLLENNLASAILVAADVQPRIMVQHILDQAVLYRVPVLIFDKLRALLRKHCGISSIVFALDKNISSLSNLNLIKENIEKIFAKCPAPENHINYHRSLDSFNTNNKSEVEEVKKGKEKLQIDENEICKSVYLKRPLTGRAFVPEEVGQSANKILQMEVDKMDFIPFTEDETPTLINNYKYKSLVVKRLKGDKNRNKRKIQSLKN